MKSKILPFKTATYDTYNSHRNLESIITAVDEKNIAWFYNSFIQVYSAKEIYGGTMMYNYNIDIAHPTTIFDRCTLVETHKIPGEIINANYKNISELCIILINSGYYITFTIDKYYIKLYKAVSPKTLFHDVLVYGYDISKNALLIVDYFGIKPKSSWTTFDEINKAYESGRDCKDFINDFVLIKPTDKYKWEFSIDNYKENLKAYIDSKPSVLYHYFYEDGLNYGYSDSKHHYYGIDTYKTFYTVIEELANNFGRVRLEFNMFHLLMKHKLLIHNSVKYLNEQNYLPNNEVFINATLDIYNESHILLNLIIKYKISPNNKLLNRINYILKNIETTEKQILNDLYNELCRHDNLFIVERNNNNEWYFDKKNCINTLIHNKNLYIKKLFSGNNIKIYATKSPEFGTVVINIDKEITAEVSLYSKVDEPNQLVYKNANLDNNNHIISIYSKEGKINISTIDSNPLVPNKDDSICEYIGIDISTKGNWINKYGKLGYDIFYEKSIIPDDVLLISNYEGGYDIHNIIETLENDENSLLLPETNKRVLATFESGSEVYFDISVTGKTAKYVSFYMYDYQNCIKQQTLFVTDLFSGNLIYEIAMPDCVFGIYCTFKVYGCYRFCFSNTSIEDVKSIAAINGVFID